MAELKEESPKAIFYALAANIGIAVCKFAAAIFSQSGSMFAEAIHSTADCGTWCSEWFPGNCTCGC